MRRRFPLTREEKERKVIELSDKGMNIRQISKRVHMNFGDIG
jgi:transposase